MHVRYVAMPGVPACTISFPAKQRRTVQTQLHAVEYISIKTPSDNTTLHSVRAALKPNQPHTLARTGTYLA